MVVSGSCHTIFCQALPSYKLPTKPRLSLLATALSNPADTWLVWWSCPPKQEDITVIQFTGVPSMGKLVARARMTISYSEASGLWVAMEHLHVSWFKKHEKSGGIFIAYRLGLLKDKVHLLQARSWRAWSWRKIMKTQPPESSFLVPQMGDPAKSPDFF